MSALVLIPAYTPPLPEDAHLTLVWPGDEAEPQAAARLSVFCSMFSNQYAAFPVRVLGTAMFGTNHDEPVLLTHLASPLALMRAAVAPYSKSEHTEFRPHVAVPALTSPGARLMKLPKVLYFNRISWWPTAAGATNEQSHWLMGDK